MNKRRTQELLALSQACLTRFWQLDVEFPIRYFAPDVVWIGSARSQYAEGYQAAASDFRTIAKELKPCHLSRQEFTVVQNVGPACTIAGRYLTTTDDQVGYHLQAQQRCTFVWEWSGETPLLRHCHISNPMGELRLAEGERFANALGETARRYWDDRLNTLREGRRIVVTDQRGTVHFLLPSEVVYAAANGRYCTVYPTTGEPIHARCGMAEFLARAGSGFTSVHRSYTLNDAYIRQIRKYEIVMADGSAIPIPERRYKEIREKLTGKFGG